MRAAIIVDDSMPTGLLANAVSCITTGLFKDQPDAYGPAIDGADCTFVPITQIAILIFKKADHDLHALLENAKQSGCRYMLFTYEGQSTTSYEQYIERVQGKSAKDLKVIGLGVIGDDAVVKAFSKGLELLR